ncbi:hypothetical protein FK220_019975, partial [Flavobacteriaceae bacterium TP-CH-4]
NNTVNIPLNVGTLAFDPATRELTYTDEAGAPTVIALPADTVTTLSTVDGITYTYISEDTTSTSFDGTDNQDLGVGIGGVANESVELTISDGSSAVVDIRDADSVLGNEVTDATDATLIRSGAGTSGDPYTLDVAADGITNNELANDAVQLENIADGTATGQVIQWDGTDWTLVDLGSVTVTENDGVIGNEVVGATNGTLTLSGSGSTISPYTLAVSADGITNNELADNAVGLENLADGTTVGQMLQWNGTDWILIEGSVLDTDNQQITAFSLDNTSNELTLTLEDGGTQTVDFSTILAAA